MYLCFNIPVSRDKNKEQKKEKITFDINGPSDLSHREVPFSASLTIRKDARVWLVYVPKPDIASNLAIAHVPWKNSVHRNSWPFTMIPPACRVAFRRVPASARGVRILRAGGTLSRGIFLGDDDDDDDDSVIGVFVVDGH